jgi:hypothetical protein
MPEIRLTSFTDSVQVRHGYCCITDGTQVRKTRKPCGLFIVLCFFISFSSIFIGFRPGINCVSMGFTTYQWRWRFPVQPIHPNVTIQCTNGLWNLLVRTIAYGGGLFHSLFLFPMFLLYNGFGSPGGLRLARGIM